MRPEVMFNGTCWHDEVLSLTALWLRMLSIVIMTEQATKFKRVYCFIKANSNGNFIDATCKLAQWFRKGKMWSRQTLDFQMIRKNTHQLINQVNLKLYMIRTTPKDRAVHYKHWHNIKYIPVPYTTSLPLVVISFGEL